MNGVERGHTFSTQQASTVRFRNTLVRHHPWAMYVSLFVSGPKARGNGNYEKLKQVVTLHAILVIFFVRKQRER